MAGRTGPPSIVSPVTLLGFGERNQTRLGFEFRTRGRRAATGRPPNGSTAGVSHLRGPAHSRVTRSTSRCTYGRYAVLASLTRAFPRRMGHPGVERRAVARAPAQQMLPDDSCSCDPSAPKRWVRPPWRRCPRGAPASATLRATAGLRYGNAALPHQHARRVRPSWRASGAGRPARPSVMNASQRNIELEAATSWAVCMGPALGAAWP